MSWLGLGSVGDYCVHNLHTPVAIVRKQEHEAEELLHNPEVRPGAALQWWPSPVTRYCRRRNNKFVFVSLKKDNVVLSPDAGTGESCLVLRRMR